MFSHGEQGPAERYAADCRAPLLCDGIGFPVAYVGDRVTPLKQQRHLAEPAQEATAPLDLVGRHSEPQVGIAPDQRLEGDLPLDSSQRRTQTDVDSLAEGDMAVGVFPADIER